MVKSKNQLIPKKMWLEIQRDKEKRLWMNLRIKIPLLFLYRSMVSLYVAT